MSWVIVRKETGEAVFETFSESLAGKINKEVYEALPAKVYLERLNKQIKEQTK